MALAEAGRPAPQQIFQVNRLRVEVYADRARMGLAAALDVARRMREVLAGNALLAMAFAAAPSQNELLAGLRDLPGLDWTNVVAFHLDEYLGLPPGAPQSFGSFLCNALFGHVPLGQVHYLQGNAPDPSRERERYAGLLLQYPLDIICLGVGENGHIAFNDPQDGPFDPEEVVRLVTLDEHSRLQQVHDGCFASLEAVPRQALTLSAPAIMAGKSLRCVVPGPTKAIAVREMLLGPVGPQCPASMLRQHPDCVLYLDAAAASQVT
jgi:glucosamine-6-phosphate deaminase